MKTSLQRSLVIALLIALLMALAALGCNRKEKAAGGGAASTETIEPARPQPEATGTGDLTQTVDIEDSRSESEGGVLTDNTAAPPTETSSTTGTTTPPPTTTVTTTTR